MSTEDGSAGRDLLSRAAKLAYTATSGPQRPLTHLQTVASALWMLDQARSHFVAAARADGADWAQIGAALGISRQAARQRYGPPSQVAIDAEARAWRRALPPSAQAARAARRTRPT